MPITPDKPFPKSAGDAIRSKDWNDLIIETQRLDSAKVDRAGDTITGSLSVSGALGVATGASPQVKLNVLGDLSINRANLCLREPGDANHGLGWFGAGKLFGGANVDGPVLFGFSGGALGTTNGGQKSALSWNNAGNVGIGTAAPTQDKLSIQGSLRINDSNVYLRGGSDSNHGLGWFGTGKLFGSANVDGPALFGYSGGVLGTTYGGQKIALSWNTLGAVGIGMDTPSGYRLSVAGRDGQQQQTLLSLSGDVDIRARDVLNLIKFGSVGDYQVLHKAKGSFGRNTLAFHCDASDAIGFYSTGWLPLLEVEGGTGNVFVRGRLKDQKIRSVASETNKITTTSTTWVDLPPMSLTINVPVNTQFLILVQINGVQMEDSTTLGAYFRLLIDQTQYDLTRHEFNNSGWELRGVMMSAIANLAAGTHSVRVQWRATGGKLTCCWYNDTRQLMAIEL